MNICSKINNRLTHLFRQQVVREQYPLMSALSRREWRQSGALGVVYMLHHIAERDKRRIPTNEVLKVSPAFLERIITRYRQQGFDFLSLDQLHQRLSTISSTSNPGQKNAARPFVTFTMDDGYLDNLTQALPIFERHRVPFAVFVATDFIDHKALLWWDSLEELILSHGSITLADGTVYPCNTFQQRWDTFRLIREKIMQQDQERLPAILDEMFSAYKVDWLAPVRKQAMTWEQLKTLSQHPLCTVGGHTVSHPVLTHLRMEEVRREIFDGIDRLQQHLDLQIKHFAYPYGEADERIFKLMEQFSLCTAYCANGGCVTVSDAGQPFTLPRQILM